MHVFAVQVIYQILTQDNHLRLGVVALIVDFLKAFARGWLAHLAAAHLSQVPERRQFPSACARLSVFIANDGSFPSRSSYESWLGTYIWDGSSWKE